MTRLIRIISVITFIAAVVIYGSASFYVRKQVNRNGPVIKMEEQEVSVPVKATEEEILKGIKAEDRKDGDVTDSLVIESIGNFFEKGKRRVTVAAFDSDNNVAKAERTVIYSDYSSPKIAMESPLRVPMNGIDKLMDGISVTDCLDGDITENLQLTLGDDTKNITTPGEYAMKIVVSNSMGDTVEMPVTVELYDYSAEVMRPQILLSKYLIYVKKGQQVNPEEYLQGVKIRNQEYYWESEQTEMEEMPPVSKSEVVIENTVDYNTPGTYEIQYIVDDGDGNLGTVRLIVVVEE